MHANAPHLPDEYQSTYRRSFFIVMLLVSLLGGIAGGSVVVYRVVPEMFNKIIATLPVSASLRTSGSSSSKTPFSDMVSLARTLRARDGSAVVSGVAFSSDGWIISVASKSKNAIGIEESNSLNTKKFQYRIEDPASDVVFIKIDSSGASPRVENDAQLVAGDPLYIASDTLGIISARVSMPYGLLSPRYGVYEAHEYSRVIVLDRLLPDVMIGAPVFDANGGLLGMVSRDDYYTHQNVVIPVHYFSRVFKEVARDQKIIHPYAGFRVEQQRGLGMEVSASNAGARVAGSREFGINGVRFNSPAWKAGLREGDMIVSIEGKAVGIRETIPEIVLAYEPGQSIKIIYERDKQVFETSLILSELK